MRDEPVGCPFGRDLARRSSRTRAPRPARRRSRREGRDGRPTGLSAGGEADEVARDQPGALVDELVEAVLPVRPRLAPVDRAGVAVDRGRVEPNALAVRLHRQLLQVGRETAPGTGRTAARRPSGAPKKSVYQTPSSPISTGRFSSSGAVRKCSSIAWKPASSSRERRPGRSRASSRVRSRSPSSSARRPSPRSRTRSPGRSRTRRRPRGSSRPRRSAGRPPPRPLRAPSSSHCRAVSRVRHRLERRERLRRRRRTASRPGRGRASPRRSRCRRRSRRSGSVRSRRL